MLCALAGLLPKGLSPRSVSSWVHCYQSEFLAITAGTRAGMMPVGGPQKACSWGAAFLLVSFGA